MLQNRHIAFFIDVDNAALGNVHYNNVIEQLCDMGEILSGKIYGAGERKHKRIFADADQHGYRIERPMRSKRRGRKEFDNRIFVDVVDAVNNCPAIDAVCIVAQPCDMVYLYSYLRARGIKIIALDNADEASCAFVDEIIDLGKLVELKLPHSGGTRVPHLSFEEFDAPEEPQVAENSVKQSIAEPFAAAEEQPQPTDDAQSELQRTDDLLNEIRHLKDLVEQNTVAETSNEQAQQPAAPAVEEQPLQSQPTIETEQQPASGEPTSNIMRETHALLDKIAQMGGDTGDKGNGGNGDDSDDSGDGEPAQEPPELQQAPQTEYQPQGESDLIRRIEEIRRSNDNGDTDELIDEIRKLLDGLE